MGQQQSKDELLHQQVSYGNIEGIKALRREGAGLEWIDREAKTPLIVACMNPELYNVAKTLIELGANVNAYRPGRHAGTPLHHAAKRGLENTVKLLLSHGANSLIMNDDCQTPLEVGRAKGHSNVVRAIESHICLFSGWMRELYGPGFLEVLAPQLVSRKVWVVVLPCGSRNLAKPFKLELAIYSGMQDAQPRAIVALWKSNLEESKSQQSDPSVMIVDNSTIPIARRRRRKIYASRMAKWRRQAIRQSRLKLAPASESDKQQLQWFCNACKGIPQVMRPAFLHNNETPVVPTPVIPATAPPAAEDLELAMAINASIQSATQEGLHLPDSHPISEAGASSRNNPSHRAETLIYSKTSTSEWGLHEAGEGSNSSQHNQVESIPSAPLIVEDCIEDGPVQYPSIDASPIDLSSPTVEKLPSKAGEGKDNDGAPTSTCVICLDAPIEGACIPCGHMAGCMYCLNEIKSKKWGCPVCRAKIEQVVKLFAV